MSLFSMANPGSIPTYGSGGRVVTPSGLFSSIAERDEYERLIGGSGKRGSVQPEFKVEKVSVRIFDLSDQKQVEEYEKLWAELLEKSARMEVVVESSKDLVHRPDGTSYWMKYVEYVEFGNASKPHESKEEVNDGRAKAVS